VLLFLLLMTKASTSPWESALPAAAWARALGLPLPEGKTARTTVSKIWRRLEMRGLVRRERERRRARVYVRREDGSGADYSNPFEEGETYFQVPLALWQSGPDPSSRWYLVLSLPELAMLLIALSLRDGFFLPFEKAAEWYGISADTASRGMAGLKRRELITSKKIFKVAPLSALGYTVEQRYTLLQPFRPPRRPRASAGAAGKPSRPRRRKAKVV
jgi:hypothetical protein